jgi:predicted ATP-dependent endonuclease of OLD family
MKYDEAETTEILDALQRAIETTISYAVIDESENLYHEDEDDVIRAIWFSRGESEYHITFGSDGWIYSTSKNIPRQLMIDTHNAISAVLYAAAGDAYNKRKENEVL